MNRRTVIAFAASLALPLHVSALCSRTSNTEWCLDASQSGAFTNAAGSRFGSTFATGDFDGDGHLDLAIGRPETDVVSGLTLQPSGQLVLVFGDGSKPDFISDVSPPFIEGEFNSRPLFTASMAVYDYTLDLIDDLVVGAPGADLPHGLFCGTEAIPCEDAGKVILVPGNVSRNLNEAQHAFVSKDDCGIEPGDDAFFGAAVSVDRNGTMYVGAPGHTANLDEDGSYVARLSPPFSFNGTCEIYTPTLGGEPNRAARLGASVAAVRKRTAQSSSTQVAFGAPFADLGANNNAGLVATHESDGHEGVYSQFSWPPAGGSDHDHFGAAIVAGDFDGDGDDDFIFAAPDKDAAPGDDIGRLYELLNLPGGVTPDSIFEQGDLGANTSETGDQFGAALAAGYINGDRYQDLVIGVPGEECCVDDANEGFVAVMFGSAAGLTTSGFLQFRQQDIGGTMTPEARFGSALATGDFNHDGLDEIVIGAPDHPISGNDAAGKVFLRFAPGTVGTTGVNLTLNFSGAENLPNDPVPLPAFSGDSATVTFTSGPIEHVERLLLSLTYPPGIDVEQSVSSAWKCNPSQLTPSDVDRTIKCRLDSTLFVGATTPPAQFKWIVPDGAQISSITRTAVLSSLTVERSPGNNTDTLTAAIAQTAGIFLNGFE